MDLLGYGLVRATVEERNKNVLLHRFRQGIWDLQLSRQPVSEMFSTDRNACLSVDMTIVNLLSWLCPTSFLPVLAKLSLFELSFSTSVRELRAMCASVKRCLKR